MEERRVRIRDIAEELGLSTATVSNVLHGKAGKASEATVRQVQQALEERGYIPSMAAVLLARNASRIIGVVVNDHEKYESRPLEDAFLASALNALSGAIEDRGRFMMVKKTIRPEEIVRFGSMWNLDGLVLIGFCDQDYRWLRDRMHIPFVVYDGYCGGAEGVCNITSDHFGGGVLVGEHFRQRGFRRALCVADNCVCVDRERYEGFCAGFGGEKPELLLVPMRREERLALYRRELERLRRSEAVFAVSDAYAAELMQFLLSHGVSVPGEVAVAGFDDTPLCRMVAPTLTSVRQDVGERAALAVDLLLERREKRTEHRTLVLPVTLEVRESTGGAAG